MSRAAQPIETAALLSTGDELVQGRTVDTNAAFLADRLTSLGIDVVSVTTVGDYPERIETAWNDALERADLVISTGGLGPTADDLTNEVLARVAGVALVLDEEQAERIRQIFAVMGRRMPDNNLKQAMLPAGAEIVPNALGTAPGYRLEVARGERLPVAVVLPGVPREMKAMLDADVLPWVAERNAAAARFYSRTFQTFGWSESALDEALADAIDPADGRLSFRASFPQISVRIMVTGDGPAAEAKLAELCELIRSRLAGAVFAEGDTTMEAVVGERLRAAGKTLATAESCTGGLIGNRITDVPGSSDYYRGGIVAYSNELKEKVLAVNASTLAMFGAVSEETACEMALGARKLTGADIAVATTGIAGPDGGTADKPVGTVAVALAADGLGTDGTVSRIYPLRGTRDWIKLLTSQIALDWVRRHLVGLDPLDLRLGQRHAQARGQAGGQGREAEDRGRAHPQARGRSPR